MSTTTKSNLRRRRKMVIRLYNPNDKPFGPLSNNYVDPIRIDDQVWPTVTNYILSSMLIIPFYKAQMQISRVMPVRKKTNIDNKIRQRIINIETRQGRRLDAAERARVAQDAIAEVEFNNMDIYQKYNLYLGIEYANTVRSATEKAYNIRFTENDFATTLIKTGNAPIEYVSDNSILGIGPDGSGTNIVGKVLMQIRFNLARQAAAQLREEDAQQQQDKIFTIYLANKILNQDIAKGGNAKQYVGKTAEQIVEMYRGSNSENWVMTQLNISPDSKPYVIQTYTRRTPPEFEIEMNSPGSLAGYIRQKEIRNIAERNKNKRKNLVFKIYTKYYAKKEKPELTEDDLDTVWKQLPQQAPNMQQFYTVRDRIYDLYKMGELSATLSDMIDAEIKNIHVPSEEEIKEAEQSPLPSQVEVVEEAQGTSSAEEPNPLKALFETDEYQKKNTLIKIIQQYTGKRYSHYKNMTIPELERELEKRQNKLAQRKAKGKAPKGGYEITARKVNISVDREKLDEFVTKLEQFKADGFKEAYTSAGVIIPFEDIARNYSEILRKIESDSGPIERSDKELPKDPKLAALVRQTLSETNQTNKMYSIWMLTKKSAKLGGTYEIEESKTSNIRKRVWKPDPAMEPPNQTPEPQEQLEDSSIFVKAHGPPIRIFPEPSQNSPEYAPLSPMYNHRLEIDNFYFPNISIYIITRLLATTGVSRKRNVPTLRGMGLRASVEMLQQGNDFVPIDQAMEIYRNTNRQTHIELEKTYMKIAIDKKLENRQMQALLLMTGKKHIFWTDPNDLILGSGTKQRPGENAVGKYLMEKRTEARKLYEPVLINSANLGNFLRRDSFMYAWIRMRLGDMCDVVYLIKNYLYSHDIEEDMNADLVNVILDKVYYPCGQLFANIDKKSDMKTPSFFVNMVMGCRGMMYKSTEDFESKISDKRRQLAQVRQESERGVRTRQVDMKEINEFERKQNREWKKFRARINAPKYSPTEIDKMLAEFDKEQEQERAEKEKVTKTLLGRQKRDRKRYIEELLQPKDSQSRRNELMREFIEDQKKERDQFLGITRDAETITEKKNREDREKVITTEISRLISRQREQFEHYQLELADISRTYWERIAVMLTYLMEQIAKKKKETTDFDIKKLLAQVQMLNSAQTVCVQILPDEEDNCIASALLNLLVGIEQFKYHYADEVKLGEGDIRLAASIILGKDVTDIDIEGEEEEEEEEEKLVELIDEKDSGEIEFSFAFNGGNTPANMGNNLNIIKAQLSKIKTQAGTEDLDQLSKFFLGMISAIKGFPLDKKIKTNRTNFFATLR